MAVTPTEAANVKTRQVETVRQFFKAFGFKRTGMGGNTEAWFLRDKPLGIELVVTDGAYHAPHQWDAPASVGLAIVDDDGPISSWGQSFPTVRAFQEWLERGAGRFLVRTHPEVREEEITAAGFTSED
jgi:hypothetical protein